MYSSAVKILQATQANGLSIPISQNLRGGVISWADSLRQHGTYYFSVFGFALCERKTKNN
jgi:hypothetical protein